jgi:hypothetical protein
MIPFRNKVVHYPLFAKVQYGNKTSKVVAAAGGYGGTNNKVNIKT